jgi:hypothetical protein
MKARPEEIDVQYIIGEVAKRHGIVLRPSDPAFAAVTINELVLKSTVEEAMKAMRATLAQFDTSIERAENRAGQILGQLIKDSAQQLSEAVRSEIVGGVYRVHSRAALRFWTGIGLLCATLLCAGSFWLGRAMALPMKARYREAVPCGSNSCFGR